MFDVIFYDAIGGPTTRKSTDERPTGGGELHLVQIAEALTKRGRTCAIVNGASCEENGVRYFPHAAAAQLECRTLVVNRYSPNPTTARQRTIIHAIDPDNPAYDVHTPLFRAGTPIVAVSRWAATTFTRATGPKYVINPCLDPIPSYPKDPNRFIYASAAIKGLKRTLRVWTEMKQRYASLADARLEIASPGYGPPDPRDVASAPDCSYVGDLTPRDHRMFIASAAGLFFVNDHTETFCCVGALAELARTRAHILCEKGLGGIPEALTNHRLLTTDRERFEEDFVAAYEAPEDPAWYARPEGIPDRSLAGLAAAWEAALQL